MRLFQIARLHPRGIEHCEHFDHLSFGNLSLPSCSVFEAFSFAIDRLMINVSMVPSSRLTVRVMSSSARAASIRTSVKSKGSVAGWPLICVMVSPTRTPVKFGETVGDGEPVCEVGGCEAAGPTLEKSGSQPNVHARGNSKVTRLRESRWRRCEFIRHTDWWSFYFRVIMAMVNIDCAGVLLFNEHDRP